MSSESTPLKSKVEILKNFQEEKSKNDILLKELKYPDAIKGYSELIKNINKELKENKEISKEEKDSIIKEYLLTSYWNLCFISIKQQDWDSTIKYASLILRFDKENTRAIYRRCFAYINKCEYDKAEENLKILKKLIPNNDELKILENMLDEKKTEDSLKQMKKYKKMMRYYHKINEETEYQNMSRVGRFFYDCKGVCKRIFCCCNKRRTVKKIDWDRYCNFNSFKYLFYIFI